MSPTSLLPALAAFAFVIFSCDLLRANAKRMQRAWWLPAALSFVFFLFSLWAVWTEGPFGFWAEHTRNHKGNQIWFDLLLALGVAWTLIVPQAKALGMRTTLWLVFVLCTGCIGLTAMVARWLYLQDCATKTTPH
jgi:uncharacterized membrane protein